ncbi:hypothetical protein [Chryseobacterium sp. MFBS3-17]|uniref:hypothetical protein n=1 Tax=Chryseobacterium sp. MFBS3-17 TaxID=2886689 RepID=UPI001D0E1544|nr:hypothetical protein [Chryseobacterium sp. MFBS3-17]MCC2591142.1 hypothetical protein [Chryseobacterium sp. MFBS3-17]
MDQPCSKTEIDYVNPNPVAVGLVFRAEDFRPHERIRAAAGGMNYVGNSLISASTNISYNSQTSLLNGTISAQKFSTQAAAGILGGAAAKGISGSSAFKGTVIGSYMQTTTRFGQTAGSAVGTVLMNTPDYSASVIQNKFP